MGIFNVEIVDFDHLPETEKEFQPDNGCGKEYARYLIIKYKGEIIRVESDAMEPEDARFYRDLNWIKDAIIQAYNIGFEEAKE